VDFLLLAGDTPIADAKTLFFTVGYNIRSNHPHFMSLELKLRKVGNSVGLLLPRAALDHLGVGYSGTVFVTSMPDGALRISALDPEFAQKVDAAEMSAITFLRVNGRVFSGNEVRAAENTANLVGGKCPESFYVQWLYSNTCE
jgi:antitoxin component of MazEF toxin-antitoxin module